MKKYIQDKKTGKFKGSYPQKASPSPMNYSSEDETAYNESYFFCQVEYDVLYEKYQENTLPQTPTLYDVLDQTEYEESLKKGHIRIQAHPQYPYLIHNYTESCTWDQGWNTSTITCRGLITHAVSGKIIARPFPKFFNHDQLESPVFDLDEEVVVMDKVDGSLAVSYLTPDGSFSLATRGSFTSEQAFWANELYNKKYKGTFEPNPHLTYLFEIIYPENRVVLDYGDTEDLILLGAVDIGTGQSIHVEDVKSWTGPTVDVYPHSTLREVLESPDRDNAEGFVLWNPEKDIRVKYKQEDYKRLHKYLTGATTKHVWEVLSRGENPDTVFAGAPDEFHESLKTKVTQLRSEYASLKKEVELEYTIIRENLDKKFGSSTWGRKEYAQQVTSSPHKSFLFSLLDNKSIDEALWEKIKPTGENVSLVFDKSFTSEK